jgi:hypothetical protein
LTDALDAHVREALALSKRCQRLLAGRSPDVQGAALVDLLALFLAGHAPEIREEILTQHLKSVIRLMKVNAKLRENLKGKMP